MSADKNDPYVKQLMIGGVGYLPGRVGEELNNNENESTTMNDQQALSCIKLKLFGSCGVGKTTIVDSLRCGYIRALFRQLTRSRQGHQPVQGQTQGQRPLEARIFLLMKIETRTKITCINCCQQN